ncbi:MAG: hypothetical protein V1889_02635 [archaeon]
MMRRLAKRKLRTLSSPLRWKFASTLSMLEVRKNQGFFLEVRKNFGFVGSRTALPSAGVGWVRFL